MKEESQGSERIIAQNCVVTGGRLMKRLMDIRYFFLFCTNIVWLCNSFTEAMEFFNRILKIHTKYFMGNFILCCPGEYRNFLISLC